TPVSVRVYIPSPFRRLTANREYVAVQGGTVGEVLDAMERQYPGFGDLVYNRERQIPTHINVYLNNQEIHDLDGVSTLVSDGDQVAIIPALAGGSGDSVTNEQNGHTNSAVMTPDEVMRYSRHIIMP